MRCFELKEPFKRDPELRSTCPHGAVFFPFIEILKNEIVKLKVYWARGLQQARVCLFTISNRCFFVKASN